MGRGCGPPQGGRPPPPQYNPGYGGYNTYGPRHQGGRNPGCFRQRGPPPPIQCYNCGQYGHRASECPNTYAGFASDYQAPNNDYDCNNDDGSYYDNYGNNSSGNGNHSNMFCGYVEAFVHTTTPDDYIHVIHDNNDSNITFCGYAEAVVEESCDFAGTTVPPAVPEYEKWLLDSGASKHMTPDASMVDDLKPLKNERVMIGDKTSLEATMTGTAILDIGNGKTMKLDDVWIVPRLAKNLISETMLQQKNQIIKFGNEWKCSALTGTDTHGNPTFSPPLV